MPSGVLFNGQRVSPFPKPDIRGARRGFGLDVRARMSPSLPEIVSPTRGGYDEPPVSPSPVRALGRVITRAVGSTLNGRQSHYNELLAESSVITSPLMSDLMYGRDPRRSADAVLRLNLGGDSAQHPVGPSLPGESVSGSSAAGSSALGSLLNRSLTAGATSSLTTGVSAAGRSTGVESQAAASRTSTNSQPSVQSGPAVLNGRVPKNSRVLPALPESSPAVQIDHTKPRERSVSAINTHFAARAIAEVAAGRTPSGSNRLRRQRRRAGASTTSRVGTRTNLLAIQQSATQVSVELYKLTNKRIAMQCGVPFHYECYRRTLFYVCAEFKRRGIIISI